MQMHIESTLWQKCYSLQNPSSFPAYLISQEEQRQKNKPMNFDVYLSKMTHVVTIIIQLFADLTQMEPLIKELPQGSSLHWLIMHKEEVHKNIPGAPWVYCCHWVFQHLLLAKDQWLNALMLIIITNVCDNPSTWLPCINSPVFQWAGYYQPTAIRK